MATRFYLPSTGDPPISPSPDSGWNNTGSMTRRAMVKTRINSSMANGPTIYADTSSTPHTHCMRQYIYRVGAGTVSGTVKAQIRAFASTNYIMATMAICVYLLDKDGGNKRTLLNVTASQVEDYYHLFQNALINRKVYTSSGVEPINLTSQTATNGDYLVVELGISEKTSVSSYSANLNFGDNSATDLGDNTTDTSAYNPYVEFSATIPDYNPPFQLTGSVAGQSEVTGSIKRISRITGSLGGQSVTTGFLKRITRITASLSGQSGATGSLRYIGRFGGTVAGQSGITGSVTVTSTWNIINITGSIAGQSQATASLKYIARLTGTVTGQSGATTNAKMTYRISGQVTGQSNVLGSLKLKSVIKRILLEGKQLLEVRYNHKK